MTIRKPLQDLTARSIELYQNSNFENMNKQVKSFYDPNIVFIDPLTRIEGRDALAEYYRHLYKGVESINFDVGHHLDQQHEVVLFWNMKVKHRALNYGREIEVAGSSHIRFDPKTNLAIYHRDYFDAGAMVYENIPLFGSLVRLVKGFSEPPHGSR